MKKNPAIFTVPADFREDSLLEIVKNNRDLSIPAVEVYGSLRNSKFGSGRKYFELPDIPFEAVEEYIKMCNAHGICFNYTLNASCYENIEFDAQRRKELLGQIGMLMEIGIVQFTVAMPSVIHLLHEQFPEAKVTLSVITGVDSLSKMRTYSSLDNVNSIYIHERVYRNHKLLADLAKIAHDNGKKVGVIANSFCLSDCPYRQYHYNFGAHATYGNEYVISEYYGSLCALSKVNDLRNVLTAPWIRPEDLDRYIDIGVDRFKISGREMHNNHANIQKVLTIYNLVDLFMCFTQCPYSEMFDIHNTDALQRYLERVYAGKIRCNTFGCSQCGLCKDALNAVTKKETGCAKWVSAFNERLERFGEVQ